MLYTMDAIDKQTKAYQMAIDILSTHINTFEQIT